MDLRAEMSNARFVCAFPPLGTYHLDTKTDVAVHVDWLGQHLMNNCPNHEQDIRTPSPTIETFQTYWLEEARAKAIHEAENMGLQGPDRETFIQERTDIYYAELLLNRVRQGA